MAEPCTSERLHRFATRAYTQDMASRVNGPAIAAADDESLEGSKAFAESHNGVLTYPVAIDIQHEFGRAVDADNASMAEMPLRETRKPREREIPICWLTEMASYGRGSPR